jgi:isocitrate dehydrogenase
MKIKMISSIVEMDGDEMTRIIWKLVKEKLIVPFVELKTEYYDLGLKNREATRDQVTWDAAHAAKRLKVAVKCATITPNAQRVAEYNLSEMWKSPNGTIRAVLDGTVFREPVLVDGIKPLFPHWTKPIVIARHAYGDVYKGVEARAKKGDKAYILLEREDGCDKKALFDFGGDEGIVQEIYNTKSSIESFAKSCFTYALSQKKDLWFSTKDTISKTYDHYFKDVFQELYDTEYKEKFEAAGIEYFYTLIDDAVARIVRSAGGMVWALKNYDGDVMSDMVATVFGSLAMMTSVLVSPDGNFEFEAAHGTVTRHYYKYLKGETTSTNPVATIFAWTGALKKRGELDNIPALEKFADLVEEAVKETIEDGLMTGDLVELFKKEGVTPKKLSTEQFIDAAADRLAAKLKAV